MGAVVWREFSKEDWYGFAGAESFSDGTKPLIADVLVDDFGAQAVLDKSGVSIFWCVEDTSWIAERHGRYVLDPVVVLLPEQLTKRWLEARGWNVYPI